MSEARQRGRWFGLLHADRSHRLLCGAVGLAFLSFPLADLTSGRHSSATELAAGVSLIAFATLWLRLMWVLPEARERRRAEGAALVAGMAALAVVLAIALGGDWFGLLIYLSVALALVLPMRLAVAGVAAVAVAGFAIDGGRESGAGLALESVAFGLLFLALRGLIGLVEELEATRGQVAQLAISEERLRLSRDMHDLLGHNLSLIALKSELARKLIDRDPQAAAKEIHDVESVARQSLHEAREAVRGLRRASLTAELDGARQALEAAGIETELRTTAPLPPGVEALLAFAAREGATNAIRHSRARHCTIVVQRVGDCAELE
ncbi:MAG: histidine kinase, partial [Chloroflexota bacterium]|nr:histidine kinase [Chloroflexota bacterium]